MSAAIEVDDVHKAFNGFKVLNGLTVDCVEDAITTVLGPSGTGKSVLLKHIIALLYPDAGDIRVFGKSIIKMSEDELFEMREGFGVLFQDGALFGSMNIYDNVAFPLRKHTGFARALVLNPKIVLFDEPDSGLDPVRTSLLCDLILKVHQEHGGTYLLVTHNTPTAEKVSDYIGLLWQGRLAHYGPTAEAFASEDPFVRQFLAGESAGPLGMD